MMLVGVIPVVLVGVVLPLGLIAGFLALDEGSPMEAVTHGELFLTAGNAAVTGCVALVSARHDRLINATIASFVVLLGIVLPCYGAWAFLAVQELQDRAYSEALAVIGGAGMTIAAVSVALVFVRLTCRSK
jgi:uncharacterized membrane protein YidH (DUF202 family)